MAEYELPPPSPVQLAGGQVMIDPTDGLDAHGPTVEQLTAWMTEHGIPLSAEIRYAGCGLHTIMLVWEVERAPDG